MTKYTKIEQMVHEMFALTTKLFLGPLRRASGQKHLFFRTSVVAYDSPLERWCDGIFSTKHKHFNFGPFCVVKLKKQV